MDLLKRNVERFEKRVDLIRQPLDDELNSVTGS
jgi:hypothetical protein